MKKIILIFVMLLTLTFTLSYVVFAQLNGVDTDTRKVEKKLVTTESSKVDQNPTLREDGEIVVILDGHPITFDVKPYVTEGTTLVPLRAIFEVLGATVEWDEKTKTVTSQKDDKTVRISIDSKVMYVNDKAVELTYPAGIINGRTLVPLRAISEAFGCLVGWDGKFLQVSIISDTYNYRMLYTPDDRVKSFPLDSIAAQLKVGWYEEPVQTLYAPGKSKVFKKTEVAAQLKVGWYEEPVQTLYAPGKSKVFKKTEVAALLNVGWYEEPPTPIKICIDAGHFGKNNRSTVYPSYYESEMTWKLHLLLKKELEAYGFEVITTREDKDVDLKRETRGEMSEGCDLFISLHSNACDDERVDKAVIIPFIDLAWTDIDDKSRAIAAKFGPCIMEVMGLSSYQIYPFRDEEEDRDGNGVFDDEYYSVLYGARGVGTPGVILEHGFHTNTKCAKWLSNESNLENLAKAEADVIAEFFGVKKVTE